MSTGQKKKPEKISVDTNVLVSAFVFPGIITVKLFEAIYAGKALLGISDEILDEFIRVCIVKLGHDARRSVAIAEAVRSHAQIVTPKIRLNVIKDEPDNRILECAVEFGADFIISGDKHMLELKKYKGIEIIKPRQALERIMR